MVLPLQNLGTVRTAFSGRFDSTRRNNSAGAVVLS